MVRWAVVLGVVVIIALVYYLWRTRRGGRMRAGHKRCTRCFRAVEQLRPYMDGRREFWVCDMCSAELDFSHAVKVDLPKA
jgi:hypothetical protein